MEYRVKGSKEETVYLELLQGKDGVILLAQKGNELPRELLEITHNVVIAEDDALIHYELSLTSGRRIK